jgi:hypothetical protein
LRVTVQTSRGGAAIDDTEAVRVAALGAIMGAKYHDPSAPVTRRRIVFFFDTHRSRPAGAVRP